MAKVSSRGRRRWPLVRFNMSIMGVGILCVVAAIVGGGVTLAGQEIHSLTSVWREILLGIFGVVLMVGSLVLRSESSDGRGDPPDRVADGVRVVSDDGNLPVELDTESTTKVLTFLGAVREAMKEKGFRDLTITRVRRILNELITNVANYVPDRTARVSVSIQEEYLRVVKVTVCDRGPGIVPSILDEHERRLREGEREHGLTLARRLATGLTITTQTTTPKDQWHCVSCEVIEPPLPQSMLFEFQEFAWVRMEYGSPMVYWFGPEYYVDEELPKRLSDALRNGWRPVLDLYLKHLTDPRYLPYLVVEAAGDEIQSRHIRARGVDMPLRKVLESYFADHFRERKVLLLASDGGFDVRWSVREWAGAQQLEYFDSDPACRARLQQLST